MLCNGTVLNKNNMVPAYLGDLVQGTNMPRSKLGLNLAVPTVKTTNFGLHPLRYSCCL